MAKNKKVSVYFCQSCGYETSKWMGQCPGCREWNTFVEEMVEKGTVGKKGSAAGGNDDLKPTKISEIDMQRKERIETGYQELDRVLGGGIVPGSLVLVGGDPGIGKSTLLLQICRNLADTREVLYISGEESLQQIKMRAQRIGEFSDQLQLFCDTSLERIEQVVERIKPQIVIIDSIQTMYSEAVSSAPGSVSQVRETTARLLQIAKGMDITVFIVGHVTKEGVVAGPRVLEHMVDTVLYFEGDRHASYRILRGVKNRFGSTNEIGMFEMQNEGLVEITNPSQLLISERDGNPPGSSIVVSLEGTRALVIELQALSTPTVFGMPRRNASGIDYNRLTLLMAVLEKRGGMNLSSQDVYINLVGGLKVNEPALDLGIVLATASTYKNISIKEDIAIIGEVGLTRRSKKR